jgi:hypothetical protein
MFQHKRRQQTLLLLVSDLSPSEIAMRFLAALCTFLLVSAVHAVVGPGKVTGDTAVHDPSTFTADPRGLY